MAPAGVEGRRFDYPVGVNLDTRPRGYEPIGFGALRALADSCGVGLELVQDFSYPGHSVNRCHAVADRSGRTLHAQLLRAVADRPEITLAVPLRLLDVDHDANAGVHGVTVAPPGGSPEHASTGAVVLATSGFGARRDMVQRYLPEIADGLYFGGVGPRGDALAIGEAVGEDEVERVLG